MRDVYVVIPGDVIWETGRAILLELFDGRKVWLPRSVCLDGEVIEAGDRNPAVAWWFFEIRGNEL
jgi:hypothetical protein